MVTESNKTIGDVVDFILLNRGDRSFVDWSEPDILWRLQKATAENTLCYCTNEYTGNITGVMIGEIRETNKFYIVNILSTERNMPKFINFIVLNHPYCNCIATMRHGRFYKEYPMTTDMYYKFMKGTK